jgi:outer membrane protein OmpA-like peptidoglycan-associated protein
MLGRPLVVKRGSKGEAERPFWISYADLMTALMVLFLVAMSVAMLALTNTVRDIAKKNATLQSTAEEVTRQKDELQQKREEAEKKNDQLNTAMQKLETYESELEKYQKTEQEREHDRLKAEREREIALLLDQVAKSTLKYPSVRVDKDQKTIDFGDRARFDKGKYALTPEQNKLLRAFVPEVLAIARNELGRKWLKQIVVEGFASPEGDYLYNLNLSMQRSQNVLCALLAPPYQDERPMTQAEREQIRDLFLVGGYSFNATKCNAATKSCDESRRVELRLEFLGVGESRPSTEAALGDNLGNCML